MKQKFFPVFKKYYYKAEIQIDIPYGAGHITADQAYSEGMEHLNKYPDGEDHDNLVHSNIKFDQRVVNEFSKD